MGSSSLRNQGAAGVLSAARDVAGKVNLRELSRATRKRFQKILDEITQKMLERFPTDAQSWGAARKGLNLFLRDATYNKDLCDFYGLDRLRRWLEVPLDKDVASALKTQPEGKPLPRWPGIKNLTPQVSRKFQAIAAKVAIRSRLARVDLDVYYWRPKQ
jgi:hypothetical protein